MNRAYIKWNGKRYSVTYKSINKTHFVADFKQINISIRKIYSYQYNTWIFGAHCNIPNSQDYNVYRYNLFDAVSKLETMLINKKADLENTLDYIDKEILI